MGNLNPQPRVCVIVIARLCRRTFYSINCDPLKVSKVHCGLTVLIFFVTPQLHFAKIQPVKASLSLSFFHESTTLDRAREQNWNLRGWNPNNHTSSLLLPLRLSPHPQCPPFSAPPSPGLPRVREAGNCWEDGNYSALPLGAPSREISCTKHSVICIFSILPSMLSQCRNSFRLLRGGPGIWAKDAWSHSSEPRRLN